MNAAGNGGVPPMRSMGPYSGSAPPSVSAPDGKHGMGASSPAPQMQGLSIHASAQQAAPPSRDPAMPYTQPPFGVRSSFHTPNPPFAAPPGAFSGPAPGTRGVGLFNGPPPTSRPAASSNQHTAPPPGNAFPPPGSFPPRAGAPPLGPPGVPPPLPSNPAFGSIPLAQSQNHPPAGFPPPPGGMPVPPPPMVARPPPFAHPAASAFAPSPGMPLGGPPTPFPPPPGQPTGARTFPASAPVPTRQAIQNRIDPSSIPRPSPQSTDIQVFETRCNNAHAIPPPSTSHFIVKDTGSCSPRFMRSSLNNVPATHDLLNQAAIPLALVISPMGLPDPADDPIPIVDLGPSGPIRCTRCKAYMNPYMRWLSNGKRFCCNFCSCVNPTPDSYFCYLTPDNRRRDAAERPELSKGTVEFEATAEYQIRPVMPVVHFFLIDANAQALSTGVTSAACSAVAQVLGALQGGDNTLVGVATFDSTVHFYGLGGRAAGGGQPHMLVVSDTMEPFAPQSLPLLGRLGDCREALEGLLEAIPTTLANRGAVESCGGAALVAAVDALRPSGGKLHAFLSQLPTVGVHALKVRSPAATSVEKLDKEKQSVLRSQDNSLASLAASAAEHQICIDLLFLATSYVDVASLGELTHMTGGTLYHYHPFSSQVDHEQLVNDLLWNVSRPQALEAVMKVRCSAGLAVDSYLGSFYKPNATDLLLPAIDSDKAVVVKLLHQEKLQPGQEVYIQCALLYTTTSGARRIRVHNLALPASDVIGTVFKGADLDAHIAYISRCLAASVPGGTLASGRDLVTNSVVAVLHGYRKYCATSSSAVQLILPEALKLLPLYSLSLLKGPGLRVDIEPDHRSAWLQHMLSLPCQRIVPMLYPRLLALHRLAQECPDGRVACIPEPLALSAEGLEAGGIYLLENGFEALLQFDTQAQPQLLQELLGVSNVADLARIPVQGGLVPRDTPFSRAVQELLVLVRLQRCGFMRLRLVRKGEPLEAQFYSLLVEDKYNVGVGSSYVEYLCQVHRMIQNKMG